MTRSVVLILLLLFSPAHAQDKPEELKKSGSKNFLTVAFENDSIGSGEDQNYTSGLRATYFDHNIEVPELVYKLAEWAPSLKDNLPTHDKDEVSVYYSLGQNLYTPDDIGSPAQDLNDRPWAAFLYGSIGIYLDTEKTGKSIDEFEFTFGVVGPAALGKQAQTVVHKHITNSTIPLGWGNQLENEPGFILSWQHRWWPDELDWEVPTFFKQKKLTVSVGPHLGVSLGNVYTYSSAGFSFRIGSGGSATSDMPIRVRPSLPGTGKFEVNGWGWSLFGGIEGRAVARNIFLDGNTFESSHSVTKYPFVSDANIGIAFEVWKLRLSYTLVSRSKEFKTQQSSELFGAASLSYMF
jgi:lipid A 3-O-deacylase